MKLATKQAEQARAQARAEAKKKVVDCRIVIEQ